MMAGPMLQLDGLKKAYRGKTALRGLEEARGVLIAGGRDKHGSYEPLVRALEDKGRALVLLGEAADRIADLRAQGAHSWRLRGVGIQ